MIARWLVSIFGTLITCLGAWIVFDPRGLIAFAELFLTPGGLWFAVVLRLALGTLLWICASASRTPIVFRILGTLSILSGISLPFVGLDRLLAIAKWGSSQNDLLLRVIGLLTAAIGAFFVWSAAPRKGEA